MRRKAVIGVLLAALVAAGLYFLLRPRQQVLTLTGTVDGNEVVVGSQITATIVKMDVQDGEAVHAGQLLATLSRKVQTADVAAAAQAIQQAQANARQSEAQTAMLTATLPAKVAQAEAQQQQTQAQLAQAKAQAASAAAAWKNAHATYQRVAPLTAQGISSQQDLDNATAALDTAQAGRLSAQAAVTAAERAAAAAQAAVADAKAQLQQVKVQRQQTAALEASARQAQAARAAAQAQLGFTQIVAPVDGVITLRAAREGEVVMPGSPIVTIFQLSDTWVDAAVAETYADGLRLGQVLTVRLPSGQEVKGPVIYKAVEADFATQRDVSRTKRDIKTVAIRVKVGNPHGELPLGMTAWVMLPVQGAGARGQGSAGGIRGN